MIEIIKLFIEFLYVGLLSFGGGYATIPLIENRIILIHKWINLKEFVDMITISQMTPGPLTVNVSTFVGHSFKGIPGAIIATMGSIIPGVLMTLFMINQYDKHKDSKTWAILIKSLRISSVALIMIATIHISRLVFPHSSLNTNKEITFTIMLFIIAIRKKIDPLIVLLISAVFGFIFL